MSPITDTAFCSGTTQELCNWCRRREYIHLPYNPVREYVEAAIDVEGNCINFIKPTQVISSDNTQELK